MQENVQEVFDAFCKTADAQLLIIMGHQKQRDILIYHTQGDEKVATFAEKIASALCNHTEIGASLNSSCLSNIPRTHYIDQANLTFTRKKLLPVMLTVKNF